MLVGFAAFVACFAARFAPGPFFVPAAALDFGLRDAFAAFAAVPFAVPAALRGFGASSLVVRAARDLGATGFAGFFAALRGFATDFLLLDMLFR